MFKNFFMSASCLIPFKNVLFVDNLSRRVYLAPKYSERLSEQEFTNFLDRFAAYLEGNNQ